MSSLRETSKHLDIWFLVQIRGDEFWRQMGGTCSAGVLHAVYISSTISLKPENFARLDSSFEMTKTSFTCLVCANWWILFASVLKWGVTGPTHWAHDNISDCRFLIKGKYLSFEKKRRQKAGHKPLRTPQWAILDNMWNTTGLINSIAHARRATAHQKTRKQAQISSNSVHLLSKST